eukprot:466005_1
MGVSLAYNTDTSQPMTCNKLVCNGITSKWGCPACSPQPAVFTIEFLNVTDSVDYVGHTLYPTSVTEGYLARRSLSCNRGCTQWDYYLHNQTIYDDSIQFIGPTYSVTTDHQFMIQNGEGCCQYYSFDNSGYVCATVYFLYVMANETKNSEAHTLPANLSTDPTSMPIVNVTTYRPTVHTPATLDSSKHPTNNPIVIDTNGYIEMEASSNACFDSQSRGFLSCTGDYDDMFYAPRNGTIAGVKLVHNSGGVQCSDVLTESGKSYWTPSNWGLCWHMGVIVMSVSNATNFRGEILYPIKDKTDGLDYWLPFETQRTLHGWLIPNDNKGSIPNSYGISGYNGSSDYIYFVNPQYTVSTTDRFMLQYTEAYVTLSDPHNMGVGYASVYFLYVQTTTTSPTADPTETHSPTTQSYPFTTDSKHTDHPHYISAAIVICIVTIFGFVLVSILIFVLNIKKRSLIKSIEHSKHLMKHGHGSISIELLCDDRLIVTGYCRQHNQDVSKDVYILGIVAGYYQIVMDLNEYHDQLEHEEVQSHSKEHCLEHCNCEISVLRTFALRRRDRFFHSNKKSDIDAINKKSSRTKPKTGKTKPKTKPPQKAFDFGCEFVYVEDSKVSEFQIKQTYPHALIVRPKFKHLQEEVLKNKYQQLTKAQHDYLYEKAKLHEKSKWMRTRRKQENWYKPMNVECILAIMIYCNFDHFQREFSQTYRESKTNAHTSFFYFGKSLKEAVVDFGTTIKEGDIKRFYHGIAETLVPQEIVGVFGEGISVFCPLSTSSCWSIAVNFAQGDDAGVIMTLGDEYSSAKYFPVFMLSDFSYEREYLFLQNNHEHKLQIMDLTLYSSTHSFDATITALKTLDAILDLTNELSSFQHSNEYTKLLEIIQCRLGASNDSMYSDYEQGLIANYFQKKEEVTINYPLLKKKYETLFNTICIMKYEWINVNNLMIIFPCIQYITIKKINLCCKIMNTMPGLFDHRNNSSWKLQRITIEANNSGLDHELDELKVYDAIEQYRNKYLDNTGVRLRLHGNYDHKSYHTLTIE